MLLLLKILEANILPTVLFLFLVSEMKKVSMICWTFWVPSVALCTSKWLKNPFTLSYLPLNRYFNTLKPLSRKEMIPSFTKSPISLMVLPKSLNILPTTLALKSWETVRNWVISTMKLNSKMKDKSYLPRDNCSPELSFTLGTPMSNSPKNTNWWILLPNKRRSLKALKKVWELNIRTSNICSLLMPAPSKLN